MKATITGEGLKKPEKIKIAPELEAVQDLMPMSAEDRAALRESIERDGIREPLRGYEIGMTFYVLSGFNRLAIACELNAEATEAGKEPPFPTVKTQTIETADKQAFAIDENKARRQLTLPDKRRLAEWLLKRNAAKSDREIGKQAGVSKNTAAQVRKDLEARGQIDHVSKRTDSKGRKQPANKQTPSKKPPSDPTGKPQNGAAGQGRGKGRGEPETGFAAVAAALATIRRTMSSLTKAEKKDTAKQLAKLLEETKF